MGQPISMSTIRDHFFEIYPALSGRIKTYSKRFSDRREAAAEMNAFCWANLLQKARRCGKLLPASSLAWVAYMRHKSGRVMSGYSKKDAMAEQTFRAGRVKLFLLSQTAVPRQESCIDDDTVNSITHALSTRERERPDVRAATRIDWEALSMKLPYRMRNILKWLALGYSKGYCARRLKISAGRLSQILTQIGDEVREFFGPENVPVHR